MNKISTCTAACLLLMLFMTPVLASNHQPSWLGLSAGQINVLRDRQFRNNLYGVELRFAAITSWQLVPSVGFQWGDAGFNYLYSDLRYPVELSDHWRLNISSGVGLYEESRLLDLGHTVEFRSGLELLYLLNNKQQVGVSMHHYSNSRLSERNPGTESAMLIFLQQF